MAPRLPTIAEKRSEPKYQSLLHDSDSQDTLGQESTSEFNDIPPYEEYAKLRGQGRSCRRCHLALITGLCTAVALTLSIVAIVAYKSMFSAHVSLGGDSMAVWSPWTSPYFYRKHKTVQWEANVRYMTLDHRFDHYWNETATSSIINTPYPNGTEHLGVISMVHQIHCLVALREALQVAYEGGPVAHDFRQNSHWPHCLDYLYQGITCYADATIERPDIIDGVEPPDGSISGYRATRTCGSSADVFMLRDRLRWEDPDEKKEADHKHN